MRISSGPVNQMIIGMHTVVNTRYIFEFINKDILNHSLRVVVSCSLALVPEWSNNEADSERLRKSNMFLDSCKLLV